MCLSVQQLAQAVQDILSKAGNLQPLGIVLLDIRYSVTTGHACRYIVKKVFCLQVEWIQARDRWNHLGSVDKQHRWQELFSKAREISGYEFFYPGDVSAYIKTIADAVSCFGPLVDAVSSCFLTAQTPSNTLLCFMI